MTTRSIDALGHAFLVRPDTDETPDVHAGLLASWASAAKERAATFDRTAGRKSAFHRRRLEALIDGGAEDAPRKRVTAERAEAHWREHEGRGEELVERLVSGLRLLPQTPIAQVASWAVWEERDGSDNHWYEQRDQLTALTAGTEVPRTGAIFIGLNAGEYAAQAERPDAWSMFHGSTRDSIGSGRHGNIRNLADHIRDTPLWGSYMTDFYKNIPSVDEQVLKALLDTASAPDKKAMTTLMSLIIRDEAAIFGIEPATTAALALGGRTANLARTTMRDWADVIEMPHYAAYVKAEVFRAKTDEVLARTHPAFSRSIV